MSRPKLRHIAIATHDPERTAAFYREAFGFEEVGRTDTPLATGVYLSDGELNLAILRFHTDQLGRGTDYVGLHHFGVHVPDLEAAYARLEAAGARPKGERPERATQYFEVKFVGPDGVVFDISAHGWAGARGLDDAPPAS
ncbi:MAG: VOC family protein [Chloroflexi bacterium]|jgi:catechol 2,3-dioxygenase-like lactoylglutathione lyase family enzyme|nr:VOC family protein [Chloroflexota bacterium]